MIRKRLFWGVVAAAFALPCIAACSRTTSGYDRYVPGATQAEEALAEVLAAWQRGGPIGPLEMQSAPVQIQVADSTRRPGQRLVGYELLVDVSGEGPRTFIVRLKLDNPREEQEVR